MQRWNQIINFFLQHYYNMKIFDYEMKAYFSVPNQYAYKRENDGKQFFCEGHKQLLFFIISEQIIQLMDSVREADEPLDIGVCNQHNRVFECYCTQCYCMICPSCLMFDAHRGHEVCRIEEGAKQLRNSINNSAKQGYLKFDRTENVLLDIRHVRLSLEENQQKIIKQAETCFDDLISTLKSRKSRFLNDIKAHFDAQLKKMQETQDDWVRKQELSQKILELQTSNDDIKLIEEAKQIVEGLQNLQKQLQYKQIRLIQSITMESNMGKNSVGFNQVKEILKNFMQSGNPTINKLKC